MQVEKVYLTFKNCFTSYDGEVEKLNGKTFPMEVVDWNEAKLHKEDSGLTSSYNFIIDMHIVGGESFDYTNYPFSIDDTDEYEDYYLEIEENEKNASVVHVDRRGWKDSEDDEYTDGDYIDETYDMLDEFSYEKDAVQNMRNTIIYLGLLHLAEDGEL